MQESDTTLPLQVPPLLPPPRPWGPWATLGFGVLIAAAFLVTQVAVVSFFAVTEIVHKGRIDPAEFGVKIETDGEFLAIVTFAALPVVAGLCWLLAWMRRGLSPHAYLRLQWVPAKIAVKWLLLVLAFIVCSDLLTIALGRPIVPEYMQKVRAATDFPLLLAAALLIAAPVSEEIFFRGFLFRGFEQSRLGGVGAVVVTATLWALIHVQYDWYGITTIVVGGILLGMARYKTQSVPLCIAMHSLQNLIATIEAYAYVQ